MQKPLTKQELKDLPGIDERDKQRIEDVVEVSVGSDDSSILTRALRGYLAGQLLDMEVSDTLLAELGSDAASFVDGWLHCLEYGDQSVLFLYQSKK